MKNMLLLGILFAPAVLFAGEKPIGDGVTDDAPAIQAMLDGGGNLVYLPPPSKFYLIGKPLRVHSNQTLRLDPNTTIRLADGAKQYLLVNADMENGNDRIQIIGGIWDANNRTQTCDYHQPGGRELPYDPKRYLGSCMMFKNVRNLRVEKLTIKDPETFGMHLGNVHWFTIEDITFDYNMLKPNMDGVHVQGGCSHGRISNLQGNTNDDMVALNADDVGIFEITRGPITDIRIDGLFCTNGFTAVRLLSAGNPVKRIRIANIFGPFHTNVISFTHFKLHENEPRIFEDISIDGIFCGKQMEPDLKSDPWRENNRKIHPVIWLQDSVSVDNLVITNISRREYFPDAAPTFSVETGAIVRNLKIRDTIQENRSDIQLKFFVNEGRIESLLLDGVVVREAKAKNLNKAFFGKGTIGKTVGNVVLESLDSR